jgi:hypothetical protein
MKKPKRMTDVQFLEVWGTPDGESRVRWTGTQADAKRHRLFWSGGRGRHSVGEVVEVYVPTAKAGFLAWINQRGGFQECSPSNC